MRRAHILAIAYIVALLASNSAYADAFFAVRSYCMPEEGRFQLEPFPISYPATKMPPEGIKAFRAQSVTVAPKSQSEGKLEITCKIHDQAYRAIVDYNTRDEDMKYLQGVCNQVDNYFASIKLYRNGHPIIDMSFGRECEYADTNKVIITQRNTGEYSLTACEQAPGWNTGGPTINSCGKSLARPNTNKPVSNEERKTLFPKDEYELKIISPTQP